MSTQNGTLETDTRLNLNTFMFDYNPFDSDFNPNHSTVPTNTLSKDSDSAFNYDFLNFDQNPPTTSISTSNSGQFHAGHFDPTTLDLPPSSSYNGTTYPTSSSLTAQNNSATPETQTQTTTPKRRNRKREAIISPAAKVEKRRTFLEKNRKAASKCRERNKRRCDRVQQQCVGLEVENRVLKERWAELREEIEVLRGLARDHGQCKDEGINEYGERRKEVVMKLGKEEGGSVEEDDGDVDMAFFLASDDDDVPSLSSRKSFSVLTDFEFDGDPAATLKVPSPVSGIDLLAGTSSGRGKVDDVKQEWLFTSQGEELIAEENVLSLCPFTSREGFPEGTVICL